VFLLGTEPDGICRIHAAPPPPIEEPAVETVEAVPPPSLDINTAFEEVRENQAGE
jgi:hypothetical protein